MTGGILQLVAIGLDNLFINGDPQISFFKIVYRRHSNFSLSTSIIHKTGAMPADGEMIVKIPAKGDLARCLNLTVELPQISLSYNEPTTQNIQNVLSSKNITWTTSKSPLSLVTLSDYNTSIVSAINTQINTFLLKYDNSNLELARLQYYNLDNLIQYFDNIGIEFLNSKSRDLISTVLLDVASKYLIYHYTNNPTLDCTNTATYTDKTTYINDHYTNTLIRPIFINFITLIVTNIASYATTTPPTYLPSTTTIDTTKISSYVSTYISARKDTSAIQNGMSSYTTTQTNTTLLYMINLKLADTINAYTTTDYIRTYLTKITQSYILQFGKNIYDLTLEIKSLVAQFYGTYYDTTTTPQMRCIYKLLNDYGYTNEYDTSYLYGYVDNIINDTAITSITSFITAKNITITSIINFIKPYLNEYIGIFNEFCLNYKLTAFTYIAQKFLIYYSTNASVSVASYLATLSISNASLTTALTSYLTSILSNYTYYLNGTTATSTLAQNFITAKTELIKYLISTIVTQTTVLAGVILYQQMLMGEIALAYLTAYVADTSITPIIFSTSNAATYSYSKIAMYKFLTIIYNLYQSYLTSISGSPSTTTMNNFFTTQAATILIKKNTQIIVQFGVDYDTIVVVMQNKYVKQAYYKRNIISLLKTQATTYLNNYATIGGYSVATYISVVLNGSSGDRMFNDYITNYLTNMQNLFTTYAGSTTLTTALVTKFFTDKLTNINTYTTEYFDKQRQTIITLDTKFIDTLTSSLKSSLVTKTNLLYSQMLSTNALYDNYMDTTTSTIPDYIITTLTTQPQQHIYEVIYNGLYALFNDVGSVTLTNANDMRLHIYNNYLDHIAKNYITTNTYDKTKTITDYVYPLTNYLNNTYTTSSTTTTFDPIYSYVQDNIIFYHAIEQYKSIYDDYLDANIIKGLHDYTTVDAYITYTNMTTTNMAIIKDNIIWNNYINFDQIKKILLLMSNGTFTNTSHFRIGMYKKYVSTGDTTNNLFKPIQESTYTELSDNIIAPTTANNINNIPNTVGPTTRFFKTQVKSKVHGMPNVCCDILQNSKYVDFVSNYAIWQNLIIDNTIPSTLASRLSSTNSTINTYTPNYLVFGTEYRTIAMLNYVPYLVVHDIPVLLNSVLKNTTISFIPYSTDSTSIYVAFMNYFNLLDGDENTSLSWLSSSADLVLKRYMYKTIAESIIVKNDSSVITIIDDAYIKKMKTVYAPSDYLMTAIFRPEGLFPQKTTVLNDSSATTSDVGTVKYLAIEWICNTYMARMNDKITSFILAYFPLSDAATQASYKQELYDIISKVINCFNTTDIPTYEQYVNNNYTNYEITLPTPVLTTTTPIVCDALSSIWLQVNRELINQYNNAMNELMFSSDYYTNSLGGMMKQIFTDAKTKFINKPTPFLISTYMNFDDFGKLFLNSAGIKVLHYTVIELIGTILGLSNTATTQYEIMVYQYLSELVALYVDKYESILALNPSTSSPNQIQYLINQFFIQQRDEITEIENDIMSRNISVHNFAKNYLLNNTTIATYANTSNTYITTLLNNIKTLFSNKYDITTDDLDVLVNEFYDKYASEINDIEQADVSGLYSMFNTTPILSLQTNYMYYSIKNPNDDIDEGFDFYRLIIGDITNATNMCSTLINTTNNMLQYYNTMVTKYEQYNSILNIRKDGNNIKTSIGTVMKKDYFYISANQLLTNYTYHTKTQYIDNTSLGLTTTIKTTLTSMINDTQTTYTSKYIGIIDTITSSTTPIISSVNVSSIAYLFGLTNMATFNPYDKLIYPYMYAWFELYFSDIVTSIYATFGPILTSITSSMLYNISNSYNTYEGVIESIMNIILNKTQLIDVSSIVSISEIESALKTTITTNLDKILLITTYNTTSTSVQQGFTYKFLQTSDLKYYSATTKIDTNLEILLLNMIMQGKPNFAWVKELGHRIIESVTLTIGGQEIETHTSELLHLIHEIYDAEEHKRGYDNMIGNTDEMHTKMSSQRTITKLYIPMRFWFCRHIGMALPLICMLYSEIVVKIKFSKLSDILYIDDNANFTRIPKFKYSMMCEYVYLDEEERMRMSKSKLEYLIDRFLPMNTTLIGDGTDIETSIRGLTEPTKYLVWFVRFSKKTDTDVINWQQNGYNINDTKITPIFDGIKILFNGIERENKKDEIYYSSVVPWSRYIGSLNDGEYAYSFSLLPLLSQPSGSANMAQIVDASVVYKLRDKILNNIANDSNIVGEIKMWGCTQNIFRVISGIGALVFYGTK